MDLTLLGSTLGCARVIRNLSTSYQVSTLLKMSESSLANGSFLSNMGQKHLLQFKQQQKKDIYYNQPIFFISEQMFNSLYSLFSVVFGFQYAQCLYVESID